jgi:hypothetical protein
MRNGENKETMKERIENGRGGTNEGRFILKGRRKKSYPCFEDDDVEPPDGDAFEKGKSLGSEDGKALLCLIGILTLIFKEWN